MSALSLSPLDAFRDAERKRTFFVEWRLTDPTLCEKFGELQDELKKIGGEKFVILQSCAKDNLHITMNELVLRNEREVQIAMKILEEYSNDQLRTLIPPNGLPVDCHSIRTFNDRVAYVPVWGSGADALKQIYLELSTLFRSLGLKMKAAGAEFHPHLTLGKAAPNKYISGGDLLPLAVRQLITSPEYSSYQVGTQKLTEVLFCVKRKKNEATPPVLLRIDGGRSKGEADTGSEAASGSGHVGLKKSTDTAGGLRGGIAVNGKGKGSEGKAPLSIYPAVAKTESPSQQHRSKNISKQEGRVGEGGVEASGSTGQAGNPFYDNLYKVVNMSRMDQVPTQNAPQDPFAVGSPY